MTTRALGHVAQVLAARTGHHLDDARAHLYAYVRAVGLESAPIGATVVQDEVADALLQARIPGLTTPVPASTADTAGVLVAHPSGQWRCTLALLCGFGPYGRDCPHLATVVVTVAGLELPDALVPTCDDCLPCWNDDIAATAVPITLPTAPASTPASTPASPAGTVATGGGAR